MTGKTMIAAAFSVALATRAVAAGPARDGKAQYLKHCGACHGPAGKGDGIAGTFMRPKPADLTAIAKENGGKFPVERTMDVIDGRHTVRAHGDPDMPVWGGAIPRESIRAIAEYLGSIQEH
jgi:mono/diheme cytochrome c family protein